MQKKYLFLIVIILLFTIYIVFGNKSQETTQENQIKKEKTEKNSNKVNESSGIIIKPVSEKDWVKGNRSAEISIIEFSDTECPFCKRFHKTMQEVVEEYNGKVNWAYRHFPLSDLHSKAPKEAEALECAGELGGNESFWKYTDRLFEITPSNNSLNIDQLPQIAKEIGLEKQKFQACLDSEKHADKIRDHAEQAQTAGGKGTPYSIIIAGDQKIPISGALPLSALKAIIDPLLKN